LASVSSGAKLELVKQGLAFKQNNLYLV
jgi:hypothetical protein